MDKQKKEITIDFDLYIHEGKENLHKGIAQGYSYAMRAIATYINRKCHIREILKSDYAPEWEAVLVALGRKEEWDEFIKERNENKTEEKRKKVIEEANKVANS